MAIINAASCSYDDVVWAIVMASPRDIVVVPAGYATWLKQLHVNKPLMIIGAGIGLTNIKNAYVATNSAANTPASCFIVYDPGVPDANHVFRFTGFTLDCDGKAAALYAHHSLSVGNEVMRNFRLHHNRVINATGASNGGAMFRMHGHIVGSIDNNVGDTVGSVCSVLGLNPHSWTHLTYKHGQADQLYIEDNVITGDIWYIVGSTGAGSRVCVRYNTANTTTTRYVGFVDIHGNQTPPYSNHAGLGIEVYNNVWNAGAAVSGRFGDYRAGRCMWYGNRIYTTGSAYQAGGNLREEYIDSTVTPYENLVDGQPQHVSDCYIWDNIVNTTRKSPGITGTLDYADPATKYYDPALAYKGVVPRWDVHGWRQVDNFDGSTGMGRGPLSSRPVSCALTGAGYIATDENKLYRWTGAAWELHYTPYTYPHPLREEALPEDPEHDSGTLIIRGLGSITILGLRNAFASEKMSAAGNVSISGTKAASGSVDISGGGDIYTSASKFGGEAISAGAELSFLGSKGSFGKTIISGAGVIFNFSHTRFNVSRTSEIIPTKRLVSEILAGNEAKSGITAAAELKSQISP